MRAREVEWVFGPAGGAAAKHPSGFARFLAAVAPPPPLTRTEEALAEASTEEALAVTRAEEALAVTQTDDPLALVRTDQMLAMTQMDKVLALTRTGEERALDCQRLLQVRRPHRLRAQGLAVEFGVWS